MKRFYLYFHYRIHEYYHESLLSCSPLAFMVAINFSVVVNIVLKILGSRGVLTEGFVPGTELCIVVDTVLLLLFSVILFPIIFYLRKNQIGRMTQSFAKESTRRRTRRGRILIAYVIGSVILLMASIVVKP